MYDYGFVRKIIGRALFKSAARIDRDDKTPVMQVFVCRRESLQLKSDREA
jgi:hypothetical protein